MNTFSGYVFRQALAPLLALVLGLAVMGVLTQGLNQLDVIVSNRNAILAFLWMTLLTLPQIVSLILPFAMLTSVMFALNRMRQESEIATAFGAGISAQRIVSPILQLACLAALAHLTINCLIQPTAFREIRHTLEAIRVDVASGLVQEGNFTTLSPNLTVYARDRGPGGSMRDVMIDDARGPHEIVYTARLATITTTAGAPTLHLFNGQAQGQEPDGAIDIVDFATYSVPLGTNFREPETLYLKASDRYLYELFFPDLTAHYDQHSVRQFLAEGHARLSSPLLNIALALLAAAGVLGGEFSRRGSARRLAITAILGLCVRVFALGLQAAASQDPRLNVLQYALPIVVTLCASLALGGERGQRRSAPIDGGRLRRNEAGREIVGAAAD